MKKFFAFFIGVFYFFFPSPIFAHEAYVLTQQEFNKGIAINTANPLAPLLDISHWKISLTITILVIISYAIVQLWSTTKTATRLDKLIKKANVTGPLIIRLAISASFFYSAMSNVVFGPEIQLANVFGGEIIRLLLFIISFMVLFGIYVEVGALIGLVIFAYVGKYYGQYMITYANYLGELIVLFIFGSRFFSFDTLFFGKKLWIHAAEKVKFLEVPIVRILYGIALMYAGYTIKFQHQLLSVAVYNQYHLYNFFHAKAEFIAAGAGLTEILIGFFILTGLVMRFTVIISLVFITLSIFYFREMLWPHFMLYGISFSLIINSADEYTVDRYFSPWLKNLLNKLAKSIRK